MIVVTEATLTTVMKGSPMVELPLVVALVCGVWLRSVSLDGAGAVSQVSVTDVSPDFIQHPNWTLLQWMAGCSAQLAGDCTVCCSPASDWSHVTCLHAYQGQWSVQKILLRCLGSSATVNCHTCLL